MRRDATTRTLARLGAALAVLVAAPATATTIRAIAEGPADRDLAAALGEAAERCLPVVGETLKVGLSHDDVALRLFATNPRFADALVEVGTKPAMAARMANHPAVHAMTLQMQTLFNQTTTGPLGPHTRQELVCHELTHIYENDLGGGARPPSHQWMREGYAMLMGTVGLETLGLGSLATVRARAVRVVKETLATGKPLPRLSDMTSFEQYRDSIDRFGSHAHNLYMVLIAEHLVRLSSHEAVATYFRLARPGAGGGSPTDNFRAAFGLDVAAFQAALDAHVAALLR